MTMGALSDARGGLTAVLDAVLPGRVYPYPPERPAPQAPAIYVTTFATAFATDVDEVATFDVVIVADGAGRAAHAMLDELVDGARIAVAASDDYFPDTVTYQPFDVDATTTLAAYTFTVQVELSTTTWCAPDPPAAVTIPVPTIGA